VIQVAVLSFRVRSTHNVKMSITFERYLHLSYFQMELKSPRCVSR